MIQTRALPLATLLALAVALPAAEAQTVAPASPTAFGSSPESRIENVETRIDAIDSKLDQLLGVLSAQKATPPVAAPASASPPNTASALSAGSTSVLSKETTITPATATSPAGTQLKPGWVVRTFPLSWRSLEKTGDVLSAFVLPESTFHLDDHVPHSLFSRSTKVAYELTGFLDVKEAGEHSLGLIIDEVNSGNCGARGSVENQVVFEDDALNGADKGFDPIVGIAKLDVGLYEVRIWIACSYTAPKPMRVRIISRSPSMTAPDVLPAGAIGYREP